MRSIVLALLVAAAPCAIAQEKAPAVRPEVGKPLQAAIDALKAKRGREALSRAREAQEVPNKTPYETYLVTRVLGQAAAAAGDAATAGAALESAANSSAAPQADRPQLLAVAAAQYYAAKEYSKAAAAAELAERARIAREGTDATIRRAGELMLTLYGSASTLSRALTVVKVSSRIKICALTSPSLVCEPSK